MGSRSCNKELDIMRKFIYNKMELWEVVKISKVKGYK